MLFFLINILLVFLGLFVILTNNPVHSVLGLISIFSLSALIFVFLGFDFLAALVLIIYVGAISVLFLFVVMMLNIRVIEINTSFVKYWWLAFLYIIGYSSILVTGLIETFKLSLSNTVYVDYTLFVPESSVIAQFGELIFLDFFYFVLIALLLLLIAVVGPVVLCFGNFNNLTSRKKMVGRDENRVKQLKPVSKNKMYPKNFLKY